MDKREIKARGDLASRDVTKVNIDPKSEELVTGHHRSELSGIIFESLALLLSERGFGHLALFNGFHSVVSASSMSLPNTVEPD